MSDVKEVKVTLMEQDVKKLARTTTRKRRTKGGALSPADVKGLEAESLATQSAEGIAPPGVVIPGESAALPSVDTRGQSWLPSANNLKTSPDVVKQVTPAPGPTAADVGVNVGPPMKGGASVYSGNGTVKLAGKKNSLHTVASTPGAPRILPTKRKSGGAPAMTTRKKERLVISTPLKHPQNALSSRTRKFRERRISITVKPGTRAVARRVREKVDALPIAQVRRALLRKGVLKPGNSKTPEAMMRSMLKDYMLLHNAD